MITLGLARRILRSIPRINRGGCGIATYTLYHVATTLYPHKKIEIEVIVRVDDDQQHHDIAANNIVELARVGAHFRVILQDSILVDTSENPWKADGNWYKPYRVSYEYLLAALNHTDWNSMFDRRYIVVINSIFSQYIPDFSIPECSLTKEINGDPDEDLINSFADNCSVHDIPRSIIDVLSDIFSVEYVGRSFPEELMDTPL